MDLREERVAELVAPDGAVWLVGIEEGRGRDGEGVLDFEEAAMVPPFKGAIEETCFLVKPAIM